MNLDIHSSRLLGTHKMPGARLGPGILAEMFNHPKGHRCGPSKGKKGMLAEAQGKSLKQVC